MLVGSFIEFDKSLIECIIDLLMYLVCNSFDYGIEMLEKCFEVGKNVVGNLIFFVEYQGGNICIEVIDDGVGFNCECILVKVMLQGMVVNENMIDDEVGMLIFVLGFLIVEQVMDVFGCGVGMDVVKCNIQEMGGYVEIQLK